MASLPKNLKAQGLEILTMGLCLLGISEVVFLVESQKFCVL
jgi:hypothetical protein